MKMPNKQWMKIVYDCGLDDRLGEWNRMAWLKDHDGRRSGIGDWRSADHNSLRIMRCARMSGARRFHC